MWTIWVWLDRFFVSQRTQRKTNSPERRYEGFGLNFLVAEEEHSLSCRNTQYWGRPKMPKLTRNGSRMDDMRNRDRENDRTGPRSIFRPLPDPKNLENRSKIHKKPVWDPSLGLPGVSTNMIKSETMSLWLDWWSSSYVATGILMWRSTMQFAFRYQ